MDAVTGANLKIARRANAQARADFATWQMMAKLRSEGTLSADAQAALADYNRRLEAGPAEAAAEETIQTLYRRYYVDMGGTGAPPESTALQPKVIARAQEPAASNGTQRDAASNNVTPFRPRAKAKPAEKPAKERSMPVALIFVAMVAAIALFKYLFP